ncbi:MAG: hypothetical protein ACE5G1_02055 [bacterium]
MWRCRTPPETAMETILEKTGADRGDFFKGVSGRGQAMVEEGDRPAGLYKVVPPLAYDPASRILLPYRFMRHYLTQVYPMACRIQGVPDLRGFLDQWSSDVFSLSFPKWL